MMNFFTRWINLFLTGLSLFCLWGCAPAGDSPSVPVAKAVTDDEPATIVQSREAIFTYGEKAKTDPPEISLNLKSEPLSLSFGYMRLMGMVSGSSGGLALIEVGGRGFCLARGEEVFGYQLLSAEKEQVTLKRSKNQCIK